MDGLTVLWFFVGLAALVYGAQCLVRGASRLAATAGVSALVIGLTVVAFGTSAPELAVSVQAAWSGQADMALGNVVGSNICNVLLILGLSAAITPLVVAQQLVWRDVPLLIGVSTIVWLLASDGVFGRVDGVVSCAGLLVYTVWIVRVSRRETKAVADEYEAEFGSVRQPKGAIAANVGFVLAGLLMLVLGSRWLVDGAIAFAHWWQIDDVVVSLTIVAVGTSLPELATSVIAALRGERDIAVGNVVGSNLFNLMGVLGLSGAVAPNGLAVTDTMLALDLPLMIAVAIACLPVFARGHTLPRWQGLLFLAYYAAYTVYLVLHAQRHEAVAAYTRAMAWFVIPLTLAALLLVALRVATSRREPASP